MDLRLDSESSPKTSNLNWTCKTGLVLDWWKLQMEYQDQEAAENNYTDLKESRTSMIHNLPTLRLCFKAGCSGNCRRTLHLVSLCLHWGWNKMPSQEGSKMGWKQQSCAVSYCREERDGRRRDGGEDLTEETSCVKIDTEEKKIKKKRHLKKAVGLHLPDRTSMQTSDNNLPQVWKITFHALNWSIWCSFCMFLVRNGNIAHSSKANI